MTGRAGVYRLVLRRMLLANPGRSRGVVLVLKCGHARTVSPSAAKSKRLWCRICTQTHEAQQKLKSRLYTRSEVQSLIRKALQTAKVGPRATKSAKSQAETDRQALINAGLLKGP